MVLLDGRLVDSCSYIALKVDGLPVTTVEGLADGEQLHPLQRAFLEQGGVQCGFCTPVDERQCAAGPDPHPSDQEIRVALAGNLCRCTGYVGILAAVRAAADEMDAPASGSSGGG